MAHSDTGLSFGLLESGTQSRNPGQLTLALGWLVGRNPLLSRWLAGGFTQCHTDLKARFEVFVEQVLTIDTSWAC
jgi:hypothetical protein